ncbi:hypothetical protein ACHAXS_003443, partial [Conticribra weissflogii]
MWSHIDLNKSGSERCLRQSHLGNQINNDESFPDERNKRNNNMDHSKRSGSFLGTGLSSRPRERDFQTHSNALFGGWSYLMSGDNKSGFQWSKYNGDDDAKRKFLTQREIQNYETHARYEYGEARNTKSQFLQSTSNEDIIDAQLSRLLYGEVTQTLPHKPTLSHALYKIGKGVTKLFRSKIKKSEFLRKTTLIGMSIVFLLRFSFPNSSSESYSYFYNYGGLMSSLMSIPTSVITIAFDLLGRVPSASETVKSNKESGDYGRRPDFVYHHPYISSSYYTSTSSLKTLYATDMLQVQPKLLASTQKGSNEEDAKTRLAIVRPFCEFDAEALPLTFACWNALPPCKAAFDDIGDDGMNNEYEFRLNGEFVAYRNNTTGRNLYNSFGKNRYFDQVGSDAMKSATADVFLFYSQTFSENDVAIK